MYVPVREDDIATRVPSDEDGSSGLDSYLNSHRQSTASDGLHGRVTWLSPVRSSKLACVFCVSVR